MDKLLVSCNETLDEITANIKGTIPDWLNVELIRLGPAKWDLDENFSMNHWLDGCAMLCKFSIGNNTVRFQSKFLDSDAYRKMMKVKRPVYTEFGTRSFPDPCKNVFSRIFSQIVPSDLTDNGCVNVYKLSNEYYSASETCNIWKICQKSLDIEKKINLDKIVGVNLCCSHLQYIDGEPYAYNMSSSFITGMKYHLIKIPLFHLDQPPPPEPSGQKSKSKQKQQQQQQQKNDKTLLERSTILSTISSSWTTCIAYYHSFGVTKNFILFVELPLVVNGFKLATCTPKGRPLKDCFEWHHNEKTRFYVISKDTGDIIQKYYSDPFFYFHIINSYEYENYLIADFMVYDNATILDKWDLNQMRNNIYDSNNQSTAKRFILPLIDTKSTNKEEFNLEENLIKLSNTKATAFYRKNDNNNNNDHHIFLNAEILLNDTYGFELPTINYKNFNGRKYKYFYASGVFEPGKNSNSICKINVEDRNILKWYQNDNFYPGECMFIPKPNSQIEDDGVLICIVLSADKNQSHFLLILDAKTFTEIARADLANDWGIIPPTIHGVYEYVNDDNDDKDGQ